MTKVAIGIQARSTSHRFPNKVMQLIGNKPMIQHVIDAAQKAAELLWPLSDKPEFDAIWVFLLIPQGDPLKEYAKQFVGVIEGDEDDVLSRYVKMVDQCNPDYVVRLTGDCPLVEPEMIAHLVSVAVEEDIDYFTNCHPDRRAFPDGYDVEVISSRLMSWLDETAEKPEDREHVTSLARRQRPPWARIAVMMPEEDFEDIKLSVDTPEDLERVRKVYDEKSASSRK